MNPDEFPPPSPATLRVPAGTAAPDQPGATSPAERWLTEHGDVLWRFALSRTRSRDIAEDVVQETILAALQALPSFQGDSSERTWLLGIAAHKVVDFFRAARRRADTADSAGEPARSVDDDVLKAMFTPQGMWANPPQPWGLDASSATERAEMLAALRGCIDALPRSQAEAVWLRDLLNIPSIEVCKAVGSSPTNLWSRMHRARVALRACVEKSLGLGKKESR